MSAPRWVAPVAAGLLALGGLAGLRLLAGEPERFPAVDGTLSVEPSRQGTRLVVRLGTDRPVPPDRAGCRLLALSDLPGPWPAAGHRPARRAAPADPVVARALDQYGEVLAPPVRATAATLGGVVLPVPAGGRRPLTAVLRWSGGAVGAVSTAPTVHLVPVCPDPFVGWLGHGMVTVTAPTEPWT